MNHQRRAGIALAVIVVWVQFLTAGCDMKNESEKVSNDLVALRNLVEFHLPAKSARWEIFGTPEHTEGIPGPTDFITLIAELETSDPAPVIRRETGTAWIAPEAARPWLSGSFKLILEKNKNDIDLTRVPECSLFRGSLKSSGKPVHGFICTAPGRALIYLTLANYAEVD